MSLGDATLTITDMREQVLSHWSLAAVDRRNPGNLPAIFCPDGDPGETLELDANEGQMIDALERIRSTVRRNRPRQGRLRLLIAGGTVAIFLVLLVFWAPGALRRYALEVVPPVTRVEIGEALLKQVARLSGPVCASARARNVAAPRSGQALAQLARRTGTPQLAVLTELPRPSLHLPGGLVAIDSRLVAPSQDPAVAAGYVLQERVLAAETDPLGLFLRQAGPFAALKLVTRGTVPAKALSRHAESLLKAPPATPDPDAFALAFSDADVPTAPFIAAAFGDKVSPLPVTETGTPVIADQDWVQMQTLCPVS